MSEKILIQLQLHKKQNDLLYRCIREYILLNKPITILKVPNSYSFHIISPYDKNYIFMVTNFPDEEGYAQSVLLKNYLPLGGNEWNILKYTSFNDLVIAIENFINIKKFEEDFLTEIKTLIEKDTKNLKDFIDLVD